MKTVYVIDLNGYFLSEMYASEEELKNISYVEVAPPLDGFKPRWNGERWIVQEVEATIVPPSVNERIDAIENTLMQLLMGGK